MEESIRELLERWAPSGERLPVGSRHLAAIEAAAQAVSAVVLGLGVGKAALQWFGPDWYTATSLAEVGPPEATVIFLLSAPMVQYACGFSEFREFGWEHASPIDCEGAMLALQNWRSCPMLDQEGDFGDDEYSAELGCIFEMYKVRTLRFLKKRNRVDAILALAQELLTRESVPADEATALIQRHLASK